MSCTYYCTSFLLFGKFFIYLNGNLGNSNKTGNKKAPVGALKLGQTLRSERG